MSVVEFLKKVGAVTVPEDVIIRASLAGKQVTGTLTLTKMASGSVLLTFTPNQGQGVARPLLEKDVEQAESDLVQTFGFSPSEAETLAQKVKDSGEAISPLAIDGALASNLFLYREL